MSLTAFPAAFKAKRLDRRAAPPHYRGNDKGESIMASISRLPAQDAEEQRLRRELAAAFRLAAHFGWDDQLATHMSARLPDGTFLMNPFGLMFEEITASSLMRMTLDGEVLEIPEGLMLNPAGYGVHSAVLIGRPDMNAAMHFHTRDGVAVSTLEEGLLPLSQNALAVCMDVGYHEFEGVVDAARERESLGRDLGLKHMLILRNHGTLACGRSIASAFFRIYSLEWACTAQVRTLAMGRKLVMPRQEVIAGMPQVQSPGWVDTFAEKFFWPAMLRKAERLFPGFGD
jgi:ribulose-5-phosphate 4-epimerase/fuculose-1-phosphate aldolase